MTFFVIGAILALIGLPALFYGLRDLRRNKNRTKPNPNYYRGGGTQEELPDPPSPRVAFIAAFITALSAALIVMSLLTAVPAQGVGVFTSFGKVVDSKGPGLHIKAPWVKVTDMDGTIQQENNFWEAPDPKDDSKTIDARTKIRLSSTNSEMFVNNQLRWRIKQPAAGRLFADWKNFDKIGPGLVQKQLSGALNEVLATYDPVTIGAKNKTNDQIAAETATTLQTRLGSDIEVVGLTITTVDFDPATQARINDFQAEVARTRVAEQRKLTATADADGNNKLSASVKDPNVLISKCLDTQQDIVNKGGSLLGVPSCFPGSKDPTQTIPLR